MGKEGGYALQMRYAFYDSVSYKEKQALITKRNQERGIYKHLDKHQQRTCVRKGCKTVFMCAPHDPKQYCGHKCSAMVGNKKRGKLSVETRARIANALRGRLASGEIRLRNKGIILIPRVERICERLECGAVFSVERWRRKRFCSASCAARRPTSPRASRGKAGVRIDIDPDIYFYSRWEANIARLYIHLGIRWQFSPRSFDIGGQTYTPDFYLPASDTYVEVKNFWGDYSRIRDEKFRKKYPELRLEVILKDRYLELQERYAGAIPHWE